MSKVYDLNKFRKVKKVTLGDETYEIRGITTRMYIDGDMESLSDEDMDDRDRVEALVGVLAKITNIPRDMLLDSNIELLNAIMEIARGDDEKEEAEEEQAKN